MVHGLYLRDALRQTTMARITPIDVIKGISGKYGSGSSDYFATNSSSNRIHLAKYLNKPTTPATQEQLDQMQRFGNQQRMAAAWLRANRPSTENGDKGTEAYQLMAHGSQMLNVKIEDATLELDIATPQLPPSMPFVTEYVEYRRYETQSRTEVNRDNVKQASPICY